jgi:hypothetical protein
MSLSSLFMGQFWPKVTFPPVFGDLLANLCTTSNTQLHTHSPTYQPFALPIMSQLWFAAYGFLGNHYTYRRFHIDPNASMFVLNKHVLIVFE